MRTDSDGRGFINVLHAQRLMHSPTVYSTFLLWMLTELFERLPEIGDPDKPRMIFFFDEAHLLFADAPKALVQKIVQVVKLIRSKGVGVYFISQSPSDIPDDVLAQLSNRIQHALRAYTPAEQKAVRATAKAFRENPSFDAEQVLMELGVGEALVSFLDEEGIPGMLERAKILPPQSLMGPADEGKVEKLIVADEFDLKYRENVDRESAYEILARATEELALQRQREEEEAAAEKERLREEAAAEKARQKEIAAEEKAAEKRAAARSKAMQRAATNAANSVARAVGTNLINSVTGGKKTSAKTIAKRAATNALNSVMRSGTNAVMRGLFGNRK